MGFVIFGFLGGFLGFSARPSDSRRSFRFVSPLVPLDIARHPLLAS